MKSQHPSISFDEFKRMPHPFGWKAEYYNDKAHFTPRHHAIKTKLIFQSRSLETTTYSIQAVDLSYKSQMIDVFYDTFRDSVEFCDWTKKDIRKHAKNNINDYFAGLRGTPLPHSVMAIDPKTHHVIGLALVLINRKQYHELDLLFVRPDYQKQGLATAMVFQIAQQLHNSGIRELYSFYHICNDVSRQWHQKFGFKEEYDAHFIRLKCVWYREEICRQEQLGLSDSLPELIKQKEFWSAQLGDDEVWYKP
jgi:N-acetylglutamate synthase-like GNAT family acetyltransferase